MLVGIDASRAIADHPTGTETYSQRLILALLTHGTAHRYRLYFRTMPPPDLFPGAELRPVPFPRLWTHVRLAWEMMRHPPDVLFVPAHVLPFVHPCRSLVTVHDLGYLAFPGAHPPLQRLYLDLSTRWNAYAAAHILADSQATKDDLVRHYGVAREKITVAYPGSDETLRPVHDVSVIESVKARHGIADDYFLYLGTLQPRKNLGRLVEAFAQLVSRHPSHQIDLVLAGRRGWGCARLPEQIVQLGLERRVLLPGYVEEADKAALLSGAIAFVFPSLYEGFGLPILEAQACGCPVITSHSSSLPEVAGEAALLIDPTLSQTLTDAMHRLIHEPELRLTLIERGFTNVSRFSWAACAKTVLRVMEGDLC